MATNSEVKLMKGNEVVAHAAIHCGCDGYFGYPITPQTEIIETLTELKPWETTGMVVLQAESETSSINMLYGGAATGKKVMTSSSSPGISLMSEGLSYIAATELPCLVVNVVRGGPGLGTIQPAQSDYFQNVKGGGHGDYHLIVLAPNSVQEMYDFVFTGFDLAFKYRNPVMILSDGVIGQMMEKVVLHGGQERFSDDFIKENFDDWAITGKKGRTRNIATSVELDPKVQEQFNFKLQAKYAEIEANEVKCEKTQCDDAEYLLVAYGSSSRICAKAVQIARAEGIKVGLFRPVTLYPFPKNEMLELSNQVKGILSVEMSAGQMIEDIKLAVECKVPVAHYGRMGGMVYSPNEIVDELKKLMVK
ncbi:MAG: 3-methyl-2-oxobutanoate dehydrogenase subunit VorB [Rikenellaceae bacterium]